MGGQTRWPRRLRPTGKPFRRKSCSHCKWKSFIILSLQMGTSYQTVSLFSSLHLSCPSRCIYHSLSLPASDSTCICCATFPPHFSVSSFYILSVLWLLLVSVFSVAFLSVRNTLMLRHKIFMDKCGPSLRTQTPLAKAELQWSYLLLIYLSKSFWLIDKSFSL